MNKKSKNTSKNLNQFLKDLKTLSSLRTSKKYQSLVVDQFPFDAQLLQISPLYRVSRQYYLALGGKHSPRVSSMMRSLSAQDLFKNEIDFTPTLNEMLWFKDHSIEVSEPEAEMKALQQFNENSLFHEQNHRIIWKLLPPAPQEKSALRRYLNFAESLVVTLDLALGDEIGRKYSPAFERMNVIYRPASGDQWSDQSKNTYRKYLLSLFCSTYFALELIHHEDILKAIDYIFPGQKLINKNAVSRGLELNELFTLNTNPQWQNMHGQQAQKKLAVIHQDRREEPLNIAADPLDLNFEFALARSIFLYFRT